MRLPTTILVPTDFSDHSAYALDYAVALAGRLGANIHVLSAIGIYALDRDRQLLGVDDVKRLEGPADPRDTGDLVGHALLRIEVERDLRVQPGRA